MFHLEGATGEPEEDNAAYTVIYPVPEPDQSLSRFLAEESGSDIAPDIAESFILLQYNALADGVPDQLTRLKIGYMRLWAANAGLLYPGVDPSTHHCRYNQCRVASADEMTQLEEVDLSPGVAEAAVKWAVAHRKDFVDMTCLVAFIFRQRGHHFMGDLEQRYSQLWRNCQRDEDSPDLAWVNIATHSLHAVFPDALDNFWRHCVENSLCRGALKKRFNCAPAGAALWPALETAWNDLAAAVPGVINRMTDVKADLESAMLQVRSHRWAGSVNRNRYAAPLIDISEEKVAAVAAVALSMLKVFSPDHELTRSEALKRTARNAPIIGGVISSGVREATRLPAYGKLLIGMSEADVPIG